MSSKELTFFSWRFFDLVLQKLVRNITSLKMQVLLMMYVLVFWGVFDGKWINGEWHSKIPAGGALVLLGGGYVTLALGRIYAKTKLHENGNGNNELDTDQ